MRISWRVDAGLERFAEQSRARLARAAKLAIGDAGRIAHEGLRAEIAAAGLGPRFAAAQRLDVYPKGDSIDAAAVLRNRIPWSGIHAEGGAIAGGPLLWLPIADNLPAAPGGRRWTPAAYARAAGPLFSLRGRDGLPLLGVERDGRTVPVFFGVSSVTLRRRIDVEGRVARAADQLEQLFTRHMDRA